MASGRPLQTMLGGVDQLDIYMVVTMDFDDLRDLTYKTSAKAATHSVPRGLAVRLINFQKMYWEYDKAGKTMVDELLTLTMEEFKKYEHNLCRKQVADPNFHVAPPPPTVGRAPNDPIQDFNKGVWQDPSSFPMMKSIEQWDNWHRVFTATAEAQGVSNVLDLRYVPVTVADSQLFNAHPMYFYAVLLLPADIIQKTFGLPCSMCECPTIPSYGTATRHLTQP